MFNYVSFFLDEKYFFIFGLAIFTINDIFTKREKQNQEKIAYIEKLGTGVVLGKILNKKEYEVAVQFKDTIFYLYNKEYYYLLEKGDSIEMKNGRIKFEWKNSEKE